MTMNHLPPQAYTKETLVHAYNWLQTQPQRIKELAVSQDVLVSLYSKAKLHGESYFEKPSFQNFRNDLKSIANMMGEFDSTQPNSQADTQVNSQLSSQFNTQLNNHPGTQNIQQLNNQINSHNNQINSQLSPQLNTQISTHSTQLNSQPNLHSQQPMQTQQTNKFVTNQATSQRLSVQLQTTHQLEATSTDFRNLDFLQLDPKSLSMVQEVRDHFNLSSEVEAIRLLISVGYQKIRSQF